MITVELRVLGRKQESLPGLSVPAPPQPGKGSSPLTLRDLISTIVRREVEAFRERQEDRRLLRTLSKREIDAGAERGKVDMGSRDLHQEVDEEAAVATALQAFEDGLYLVLIDEEEQRDLDREVRLGPDSRVTFLRLAMLAGG